MCRNTTLLFLLTALTTACPSPKSQRPDAAYQAFAAALTRGDWKTSWNSLSKPTRAAIEERQKKASDLTGGAVPKDAMLTFFASGYKPRPIDSIRVVSEEGDTAVIEIRIGDAGDVHTQTLVREGDRWVVDLTEQFK